MSINRRIFAVSAGAALAGCAPSIVDPRYVIQVVTRQDANVTDIAWRKTLEIAPSTRPKPIVSAPTPPDAIRAELLSSTGDATIEAFLARTDTKALLALKDRALLAAFFAQGAGADTAMMAFSVTKSVTALMLYRAIDQGAVSRLDAPITDYLPELAARDDRFRAITLAHLLDMRSGLAFESAVRFPFVTADAARVYYASDLRALVLAGTRIIAPPGAFLYNDYNPNLLGFALERAAGADGLARLRTETLSSLGFEDRALWCVDDTGFPFWEAGFALSPRDLAKLAAAMARADPSVMAPRWRDRLFAVMTPHPPAPGGGMAWDYRGGFWLFPRSDGAADFSAIGRFSQLAYASPAHGVSFVRMGGDRRAPPDGAMARLFHTLAPRLAAL